MQRKRSVQNTVSQDGGEQKSKGQPGSFNLSHEFYSTNYKSVDPEYHSPRHLQQVSSSKAKDLLLGLQYH